jgi:hypothetical protein
MMSLPRTAVLLLMIAAGVLTSIEAEAQAGGRPVTESRQQTRLGDAPAPNREQQLANLHAWLGRLVGQFQVTSSFDGLPVVLASGSVILRDPPQIYALQCVPVGSGSGVLCLNSAKEGTVGEPPLAFLFGVDAERLGIRALEINGKAHANESFGLLSGDTATLHWECPAASGCVGRVTMSIHAPPGRGDVQMYRDWNAKLSGSTFRTMPARSRTELRRQ